MKPEEETLRAALGRAAWAAQVARAEKVVTQPAESMSVLALL